MKKVIRKNVWETNSSTSHSCVIMTEEQHKKWEEENLYYYKRNAWVFEKLLPDERPQVGCLYTQDEVLSFYELTEYKYNPEDYNEDYWDENEEFEAKDNFIREFDDFISYNSFNNEYLEYDETEYTTPGGEKIIVSCLYGTDY